MDKLALSSRLYGFQNTKRYREMFLYTETKDDGVVIDRKCVAWDDIKSLFYKFNEPPDFGCSLSRVTHNSVCTLESMDNAFFLRDVGLIK